MNVKQQKDADIEAMELRQKLVGMCRDITVADLPIIEEYVKIGSYAGIYKKAIADVRELYESYSRNIKEPVILEFMEKLITIIQKHFLSPSYKQSSQETARGGERENDKLLGTEVSGQGLSQQERLLLVQRCNNISINDLPAITKFVMTGKEDGLIAKRIAVDFENLKYYATFNGEYAPVHFVQEVAKLIQHCFDGSAELSLLDEKLCELSNIRD